MREGEERSRGEGEEMRDGGKRKGKEEGRKEQCQHEVLQARGL